MDKAAMLSHTCTALETNAQKKFLCQEHREVFGAMLSQFERHGGREETGTCNAYPLV